MTELKIKIPEAATLQDIIMIINHMKLVCQSDDKDPEFQKWIYEHKHWFKDGKE